MTWTAVPCPECGTKCGDGEGMLPPGALVMCTACGYLGISGLGGVLSPTSPEERADLLEIPEVVHAVAQLMAAQEKESADRAALIDHGRALLSMAPGNDTERVLEAWADNVLRRGFHTHGGETP